MWNRTSSDTNCTTRIRDTLRRVLNLPPNTPMEYKSHNDSLKYIKSVATQNPASSTGTTITSTTAPGGGSSIGHSNTNQTAPSGRTSGTISSSTTRFFSRPTFSTPSHS